MPHLQFESDLDTIRLDDVFRTGQGFEALAGVTGVGLPPVSVQYLAGAGDGAKYRGTRVQTRVLDIPIYAATSDREALKRMWDRLVRMITGQFVLRWVEDNGDSWELGVHRTGGGDFVYGVDTTGERDLVTVLTVTAGDPYWTFGKSSVKRITNAGTGRGLLDGLSSLKVSSSQAIGTMTLDNQVGTSEAYPIWEVRGPGSTLDVRLANGRGFTWTGTLLDGEVLEIDTQKGTCRLDGVNAYASLAPAPKLFSVPVGITRVTASLLNVTADSYIQCSFRPRKQAIV